MRSFVINLPRDAARMQTIAQRLDALGLPFERFDAVDGRRLEPAELDAMYSAQANRVHYPQPLVAGEIGCYASHLALWQRIADSGDAAALVLEDDVEPTPLLRPVLDALAALPPCWDMVKLIGRDSETPLQSWPLVDAVAATAAARLIRYRRVPSLTGAYAISRAGALRLLAARRPFFRPIDIDLRYWWECKLRVFGVAPYPVRHADAAAVSSIGARRTRVGPVLRWRKMREQWRYSRENARATRALLAEADPLADGSPPR
jgi:glycosyl transferase, family 25